MDTSKRQSESKVDQLREQLQSMRAENRQLRRQYKSVLSSRAYLRVKVKALRIDQRGRKKRVNTRFCGVDIAGSEIKGHRYSIEIVSLCVCIFGYAGCSLRGVRRVLLCLGLELGLNLGDIPSKSSIENWVGKMGLYLYEVKEPPLRVGPYAIILDESMTFGTARMLVALGVGANKANEQGLDMEDVWLLGFSVRTSWKWQEVKGFLRQIQEKVGSKAEYVISDGGVSLKKAIEESGLIRICDAGHELCKFMEQTYKKDTRFKEWIAAIGKVRFQVYMTDTAYLIPPKQRTVARFTNLSGVATWALKMLEVMPTLDAKEQQIYGWLENHRAFIGEFAASIQMNEAILKTLKNNGLSDKTIQQSIKICQQAAKDVPEKHRQKIIGYLNKENQKLPKQGPGIWHASSDILESLFGKYKSKAATNPMNGVTSRALHMALMTDGNCSPGEIKQHVKDALEGITMRKLAHWKKEYLPENQLIKRRKTMKK